MNGDGDPAELGLMLTCVMCTEQQLASTTELRTYVRLSTAAVTAVGCAEGSALGNSSRHV